MENAIAGRIHSIETLGAADGPGVRMVVFLQGCPLRCRFCHNPDTWDPSGGQILEAGDILQRARRLKPYLKNGGITFSGGEPLLQGAFLAQCLKTLSEEGFHTAIDTSGCVTNAAALEALDLSDLVLLDIKHTLPGAFRELTGGDLNHPLHFLKECNNRQKDVIIRQVILPGMNDTPQDMARLAVIAGENPSVKGVELLPYHAMGRIKWEKLGLEYPLKTLESPSPQKMEELNSILNASIHYHKEV